MSCFSLRFLFFLCCLCCLPTHASLLSLCPAGVVDNLQTGGFFNEKVTKSCLFFSVHDAVLYFQAPTTQKADEVTWRMRTQTSTHAQTVSDTTTCLKSLKTL